MDYLDEMQERLENGVQQKDIDEAVHLLNKHRDKLDTFPCECHGDLTADEVIACINSRGDHWEEYVVSVLCGVAVSEEIAKSYASEVPLSQRLEGLLDLTRDFVIATNREDSTPLLAEQLGAHFCIESAIFRERLIKMEHELETYRRLSGTTKTVKPVN